VGFLTTLRSYGDLLDGGGAMAVRIKDGNRARVRGAAAFHLERLGFEVPQAGLAAATP
jgi:hypothetical protein